VPNELDIKIQQSIREWVDLEQWTKPFAVTLTFKKSIVAEGDIYGSRIYLDEERASKNVRNFITRLTKKVHGNLGTRFGKKLRIFIVFEQTDTKALHCHAIIDCPKRKLVDQFPSMIEGAWQKTPWGNLQTDVKSDANNGWVIYITKNRDKYNVADSIDWENVSK
jgi:hypothetical protein